MPPLSPQQRRRMIFYPRYVFIGFHVILHCGPSPRFSCSSDSKCVLKRLENGKWRAMHLRDVQIRALPVIKQPHKMIFNDF